MDFEFSADQQMLRESVRRFLTDRAPIRWVREMYDDPRGTTDEVWKGLAELGVTAILVGEDHGGLGLGMVDMGVVLEEMGRAVHPGPFLWSAVGATSLVSLALASGPDGSNAGRSNAGRSNADADALLAGLASGERIAAPAIFEPGRRWAWQSPSVVAKPIRDPSTGDGPMREGWQLTGVKEPVADAEAADALVVTAAAGDGVGVFVVEPDDGVRVEPRPITDGSRRWATVHFEAAPARRIGEGDASGAVEATLDRVMVGLVVDGVGAAAAALELAVGYAGERTQFDRPIGSFQAIQHLCADMLHDVELSRAGAYYALWACDQAPPDQRREAATMAKAWASDALCRVGASTIQVHGGIGFTWEHDAHLFYKRLLSLQHDLGGTAEHLERLAQLVLD